MIGAASAFAAELETKDHLLLPLGELPESTRRDLLKKLSELAEDGDTLSLLEQTVRRILTSLVCASPKVQASLPSSSVTAAWSTYTEINIGVADF